MKKGNFETRTRHPSPSVADLLMATVHKLTASKSYRACNTEPNEHLACEKSIEYKPSIKRRILNGENNSTPKRTQVQQELDITS